MCPSQDGATNWFSPSFNPATGLYYVQTFEKCSIYTKSEQGEWESGKTYLGGSQRTAPDPEAAARCCKAIDIRTGAIKWELPQPGPAQSWGGTLATATGLVIFGEEGGGLMAADAVDRQAGVDLSDQPDVEGLADDLHVRRPAVHRGGGGIHHHRAARSPTDMKPLLIAVLVMLSQAGRAAVPAGGALELQRPRDALSARRAVRLLPGHALRLVRRRSPA